MRFRAHYGIAKDIAGEDATIFFLMGALFPDYIERHRIHRTYESLPLIRRRIVHIHGMRDSALKEFMLGTVMHYVCDYCCYSHGEKYYEVVHHRIYENAEQEFYRNNPELRVKCLKRAKNYYEKHDKTNLINMLASREQKIKALNSVTWWTDERIMEIDLYYAYALCYSLFQRCQE